MGLHVEHRCQAFPPQPVLLSKGHGHRCQQVVQGGQPLQRQRVVRLPAEGGGIVEQPDARPMREEVVVHGRLLVKQRPGLVTEAGQGSLVRPEVCAVEDDGSCALVQLDLSGPNLRLLADCLWVEKRANVCLLCAEVARELVLSFSTYLFKCLKLKLIETY